MACTARLLARAEVDAEPGSVDLPSLEQAGVPDGPRGYHRRHGFAGHDAAERGRRRVRFAIVHPAAHVGVEREILDPEQDLLGTWRQDRGLLEAEVGQPGLAERD